MLPILCFVGWKMGFMFGATCFRRAEELGSVSLSVSVAVPFGSTISFYFLYTFNPFPRGIHYITDPRKVMLSEVW